MKHAHTPIIYPSRVSRLIPLRLQEPLTIHRRSWLTALRRIPTMPVFRGVFVVSSQLASTLRDPTLTLYDGQEELTPEEWEGRYIDTWLLLQVTAEDEAGEPVRARLMAITSDPMNDAFQRLWRSYADRGILTLFTHSHYSEPRPAVVAHAT